MQLLCAASCAQVVAVDSSLGARAPPPPPETSASAAHQLAEQTALVLAERALWVVDGDETAAPDLRISERPGGGQRYRLRSPLLQVDIDASDDRQGGLGSHVWGSAFATIVWLGRARNQNLTAGKRVKLATLSNDSPSGACDSM